MGQLKYIISIMFIGLFTLAILGFAINFAEDNDATISIADDEELSSLQTDMESQISSSSTSTESTYSSLLESSVGEGGETLESGGTISLTITNAIPVFTNILNVGYIKIFGDEGNFGVFLTAFITMILFVGAMYFIKTWLGRNPD